MTVVLEPGDELTLLELTADEDGVLLWGTKEGRVVAPPGSVWQGLIAESVADREVHLPGGNWIHVEGRVSRWRMWLIRWLAGW